MPVAFDLELDRLAHRLEIAVGHGDDVWLSHEECRRVRDILANGTPGQAAEIGRLEGRIETLKEQVEEAEHAGVEANEALGDIKAIVDRFPLLTAGDADAADVGELVKAIREIEVIAAAARV